ncbi:PRC-barrel domain containing protein [Alteromonas sediminis]|uniref:PRC-barrel domain containing protein n=1 Tax=Alteromonas sediminis TaxID=2259342 RepID=A0A3N5Y0A7_9ALTE|nr:PRC-barrel domain-containing protein [Alteromonas sediminis]RPJ67067.1 PRC-barrel domain containing protein [Alteromonas sediminis]
MLSFVNLQSYSLHATNGNLGHIKDCLFDDQDFVIRYFLVDTSNWIPLSQKVLISPISIKDIDEDEKAIDLTLSRELVKESPSIEEHKPVSRDYEELLFQFFGYGYYWIGPGAWGDFAHPTELVDHPVDDETESEAQSGIVNHIRSCKEIIGYDAVADGKVIGQIRDFIFDKRTWAIRELIISQSQWVGSGDEQHIDVQDCKSIDWPSHCVEISSQA